MPDDSPDLDTGIILAAYADTVKDAFKIFAENLGSGQNEQLCQERFRRALLLVRKARDLALQASAEGAGSQAAHGAVAAKREEVAVDPLSAEDRALIDAAVGGTTGVAKPVLREPIRSR